MEAALVEATLDREGAAGGFSGERERGPGPSECVDWKRAMAPPSGMRRVKQFAV